MIPIVTTKYCRMIGIYYWQATVPTATTVSLFAVKTFRRSA